MQCPRAAGRMCVHMCRALTNWILNASPSTTTVGADSSTPLLGLAKCEPDARAINVAVVGRAGVGKTSVIAALMQYEGGFPRPGQGTSSGSPTRHDLGGVKGTRIVLWEFPVPPTAAAGGPSQGGSADPFRGFQGVVVVTNNRWMQFEAGVVTHCRATSMPFVVARTKLDEDLASVEEDQGLAAADALGYIRRSMHKSMQQQRLKDDADLFLLAARRSLADKFCMPRLRTRLQAFRPAPTRATSGEEGADTTSSSPRACGPPAGAPLRRVV